MKSIRNYRALEHRPALAITLGSAAFVVLVMLLANWNIQQDDSYIFYSYAENIGRGVGYQFNPGERVNATTSPLYTLLLSLVSLVSQPISFISVPLAGHILGATCLFLTTVLLFRSLNRRSEPFFPYLLPLVFLASPLLRHAVGMEVFLSMMLGTCAALLWSLEKRTLAALACSLATIARPDMVLLAFVIFAYDLALNSRLPSPRMVATYLLPGVAWLLFSQLYFGTVLPSTLAVKIGQTASGRWGDGLIFLKGLVSSKTWQHEGVLWAAIVLVVVGSTLIVRSRRRADFFRHPALNVLVLWNGIYLLVYGLILNPPGYRWYYTPLSLSLAILTTVTLDAGLRWLNTTHQFRAKILLPVAQGLLVLVALVSPLAVSLGGVTYKYENYRAVADWLNENAPLGSSVGSNEIGILRFYYDKGPIIDGLGLVTPMVAQHVSNQDYSWYVHSYRPAYLVFRHPHRPVLEGMVKEDWFEQAYELQNIIDTSRMASAIYQRRTPIGLSDESQE